jgi:glycosyltransferase involved in cell wall biosynthesis
MRVLICHELYEPDFAGGGEVVVHKTALHLSRLGVEVKVITTGDPALESIDGIATRRLPISRYRFNLAADEVTEMARSADLIQTFNYHACLPALAAGRRTGKPVVCGVLGLFGNAWSSMRGPVIGRLFQAWERRLLLRNYAKIFFLSDYSRRFGIELGVKPEKTFIASPGVDCEVYRPARQKQDFVLFAAKLDPRKGVDELVAVAKALPEVRFRVVAWGDHRCALPLRSMANVEMIPFNRQDSPRQSSAAVGEDILRQSFASARIFFFPSYAETYGMVLVEAMASGCAMISTIDLGFDGIRVTAGDVPAMVAAVRELWDDREKSARMGDVNVQIARKLTWEGYAETLQSAYREILAGN